MFRIGPRLWKTGLAVAATILLLRWIGHPTEYGAVAAALAIAPSATRSLKTASLQISAHVLGGVIGSVALFLFGNNPLVIGLTVVGALVLCQRMNWQNVTAAVVPVTLFVMAPHPESAPLYAFWRLVSVAVGAVVGTAVNALVLPPDYLPQFKEALTAAGEELDGFILNVTDRLDQPASFTKAEILAGAARVEKRISEARRIFLLLGESARMDRLAQRGKVAERSIKVLESLLERILVIHKASLTAMAAADYRESLPAMQEALRQMVLHRRALYGHLWGEPVPATLQTALLGLERTFETPITPLPSHPAEVETFFRLHRMQTGISYMANRLGRLLVAMESAELATTTEDATLMLPVGGD